MTDDEFAITRTTRLSERIAVTMTVGLSGQVCEWDPDSPDKLGFKRDSILAELARHTGLRIAVRGLKD
jgi:hypothetical protein